jgi:GT2 family glycosyltransferase
MKASVIISAYNNLPDLHILLPSIQQQALGLHEMEVLLRDDGSADGSHLWVKRQFPWIRLIEGDNVGFSKSNNITAALATGDILVFINADTIMDRHFIAAGLDCFEQDPRLGGLHCNMIMPWVMDVRSFLKGKRLTSGYGYFLNRYGFADYKKTDASHCDSNFISGGGCFVRSDALAGEPPFSENLWGGTSYCEDLDLSLRLLADEWRICFDSKAVLYHNQQPARGPIVAQFKKFFRVSANRITVYAEGLSLPAFISVFPGLLLGIPKKLSSLHNLNTAGKFTVQWAAIMITPFFLFLTPYWIYRNLFPTCQKNRLRRSSFLKEVFV